MVIIFSISSTLILFALFASSQFVSRAVAQTPQRDNRPRTASINGRVMIAGKPAVNAVITVREIDLKPDADGLRIPHQIKTRTDGDGRYLAGGLAEGRYFVSAMLKAFVGAGGVGAAGLGRTVTLDEGEAREGIDFALIRGGVITGKVTDNEGAPLVAKRVRLYTVNEHGQKRDYYPSSFMSEMSETDDRGVYRIYGLPPGRYLISAGGEEGGDPLSFGRGKFALTWHPDTTDEKRAEIIELEEGSEATDIDIRFGNSRNTYEAAGSVSDRDTGKSVPGISVSCSLKREKDSPGPGYSTTAIADGQGDFRLTALPPGRYQARIDDNGGETGYTGEITEFEITNDNIGGVEVKVFQGAIISGVVLIDGGSTAKNKFQGMSIVPMITPANGGHSVASYAPVQADGSFTIKGLPASRVTFRIYDTGSLAPVKRIERDGVEIKDAIEVRPGEEITGVRIVLYQAQGRIRGQLQITGGSLPDGLGLFASAMQSEPTSESNLSDRIPVASGRISRTGVIDEKGRFVIEGLPAGEYDLSIFIPKQNTDGNWEASPLSTQHVTVSVNGETPVTVNINLNRINQPNNRPDNQEDRR